MTLCKVKLECLILHEHASQLFTFLLWFPLRSSAVNQRWVMISSVSFSVSHDTCDNSKQLYPVIYTHTHNCHDCMSGLVVIKCWGLLNADYFFYTCILQQATILDFNFTAHRNVIFLCLNRPFGDSWRNSGGNNVGSSFRCPWRSWWRRDNF